jgi:UPF0271 protein
MSGSERLERSGTRRIDLNADLGEGCGSDRALLERVSSASVCCGAHAGDPATILETLWIAGEQGVVVGAHPGFPDPEGFGRREQRVGTKAAERLIMEQVTMLVDAASILGLTVRFLKPHGALYNQAQRQEAVARGVLAAAKRLDLPCLGQPGTLLETLARKQGVRLVLEGFPDRRYATDGSLVPRSQPGAVLHDLAEIEDQVMRLVAEGRVETLCVHGDEPAAVANAERVMQILDRHHIAVRSFLE